MVDKTLIEAKTEDTPYAHSALIFNGLDFDSRPYCGVPLFFILGYL